MRGWKGREQEQLRGKTRHCLDGVHFYGGPPRSVLCNVVTDASKNKWTVKVQRYLVKQPFAPAASYAKANQYSGDAGLHESNL